MSVKTKGEMNLTDKKMVAILRDFYELSVFDFVHDFFWLTARIGNLFGDHFPDHDPEGIHVGRCFIRVSSSY